MNIRKRVKYLYILSLVIISIVINACSTANDKKPQNAEEMYNLAIKEFEDEDWEDANKLFEVIKLQYAASKFADDAQYHIAEINYNKGEFILAAYNYNSLRRTYPTSKYYKTSLFKAGLCYYELSPPYDRDQEYTYKAIEKFQDYQRLYAGDSLSEQANIYIDELRDKLAHRAFFTAKLYMKLHSRKSALIYLDVVIAEFPDTKYYELAYYEKIKILATTFRNDELHLLIDKYKSLFPDGEHLKEVLEFERTNPK
jgi:outer membrane protein assembly factor BamD